MPGTFAQVGTWYLHEHDFGGASLELFAKISEKNHSHSTRNPLAAYGKAMSLGQIMGSSPVPWCGPGFPACDCRSCEQLLKPPRSRDAQV